MKDRNMLLFVISSMALLGGYYLLTNRLYPQKPAPAASIQTEAPVSSSQPTPANESAPKTQNLLTQIDPKATVSIESEKLKLTWRKQDGALIQATWLQDGTRFFPWEERDKSGKWLSLDFPGMGGSRDSVFVGEPEVSKKDGVQTVVFRSATGDLLSYRLPDQGQSLSVDWTSSRQGRLYLVRSLKENPRLTAADGSSIEVSPFHNLGRVFTLNDKGVQSVNWADMLKDPFFSFLGSKRKVLPPADQRLGLDAGLENMSKPPQTHYFAALWDCNGVVERDTEQFPGYHLVPGPDGKVSARLYLGPKQAGPLAAFGKPFTQVVDFGFFGLVAKFLFWILRGIHRIVPDWGWTIVLFSILLRLAMWPLNTKTTVQMLRMKDLEPQQKAIQAKYEKYGSDMAKKAEMQKELMAFYKKNGHNPMGGCLPMLLQMPIFMALWSMLKAVFELRHSPFLGYIHDLSSPDRLYILPVLLGVSMIAQQAMTPATGDPAQRKMMMFMMPIMMIFIFSASPAGLCLYYFLFNLIGMVQTWWIKRNYQPQPVVI